MKTFYFTCISGYVGGSGVVQAKSKKSALKMANDIIRAQGMETQPIVIDDLIELKATTAVLITNGDY
jgi:phosphoribosylamine-glycine ligase